MAIAFKNYYDILGVSKDDSQDSIKHAYRKLARKHHPDLDKSGGSEDRFKEINEAYEVLKDPDKRQKYDRLGSRWQQGDPFDYQGGEQDFGYGPRPHGERDSSAWRSQGSPYSDFFEALFGGRFHESADRSRAEPFSVRQQGADHEALLRIPLEEAFQGGTKSISLQSTNVANDGTVSAGEKRYDVQIPPGILPGQRIRLAGQGGPGSAGGDSGDLYLKVEIVPHLRFRLEDRDLFTNLAISPWEAALGTSIDLPTLAQPITLKVPAGTQGGHKLRLRGKGMPSATGCAGNLYAVVQVRIPKPLAQKERQLFEELANASSFNPRKGS